MPLNGQEVSSNSLGGTARQGEAEKETHRCTLYGQIHQRQIGVLELVV
jgi:hypothetical protein